MDITHTSVAGVGLMHDCVTRSGAHFRVLEDRSGSRTLYVYRQQNEPGSANSDDEFATIVLDEVEADQVANILHSRPISDRVAHLERRFSELIEDEN